MMTDRTHTRRVMVGGIAIGGGAPITVQSMTTTDTHDVSATAAQIERLRTAGCKIVRVAVPDLEAAEAVGRIKQQIGDMPLVADIHFDYRIALRCIAQGADKIRLNPGNIGGPDRVRQVAESAKAHGIPIRIGINGGSLEKDILARYGGKPCPEAMTESAMGQIHLLESCGFEDIVISLKASSVPMMIAAYCKMAELCPYPLHVGVTEAGTSWAGTIKSAAGIGAVLAQGIGDTIRVSLTGDPAEEVKVGRNLLQAMELGGDHLVTFISCPTCGRCRINLIDIAGRVEEGLMRMADAGQLKNPITAAVMGCAVNGPGEAAQADIGIAGGDGCALLFAKGKIVKKLIAEDIVPSFLQSVTELTQ